MKFPVYVEKLPDGRYLARATHSIFDTCEVVGASPSEAIEGIREEIRYRIEWCPCSRVDAETVELEVRTGD